MAHSQSVRLMPDLFEIKAISPERQKPEHENYEMWTRMNSGDWAAPRGMVGTLEVRAFLQNYGIDPKTIETAIAELSNTRHTVVSLRVELESLTR
jgi:hypothetical protein